MLQINLADNYFLRNFEAEFMKKYILSLLIACMCANCMYAADADTLSARRVVKYQGPEVQKFSFETRFGWQMARTAGVTDNANTGFRGEFINFRIDARLYKGLSFSWRQRLNITNERNFWNSTDWMVLNYAPNEKWVISAGKQVVAIGGFEYDRAPIDLYTNNSVFWNHIACYQLGASVSYNFNKDHRLLFQLSNSPFREAINDNNTYGFSLMWNGKVGLWQTIWSVNAFQGCGGRWMNFISLGNRFNFIPRRLWLDFDFINRASSNQTFFFDDYSVMTEISGKPHEVLRLFAKYTYDVNRSDLNKDFCVMAGTKMQSVSGGIEYEPLKDYPDVLRIFGAVGYCWGKNANTSAAVQDDQLRINVGVKVNMDVLKGLRYAVNKW